MFWNQALYLEQMVSVAQSIWKNKIILMRSQRIDIHPLPIAFMYLKTLILVHCCILIFTYGISKNKNCDKGINMTCNIFRWCRKECYVWSLAILLLSPSDENLFNGWVTLKYPRGIKYWEGRSNLHYGNTSN